MLDQQKEDAITCLLLGEGPSVVSKKVGVSRQTIYNWLENDEFKTEIERRRKQIASQGNNYILGHVQTYIEKLSGIALSGADKRTSAQALMYLIDRSLGKTPTVIQDSSKENKHEVTRDVLEEEFEEFDMLDKRNKFDDEFAEFDAELKLIK